MPRAVANLAVHASLKVKLPEYWVIEVLHKQLATWLPRMDGTAPDDERTRSVTLVTNTVQQALRAVATSLGLTEVSVTDVSET